MKSEAGVRDTRGKLSIRQWRFMHVVLILLAGATAYSNTLQVPFVLDGYSTVRYYGPQEFLDILLHGSPRRIVDVTFAINYHLHGLQVSGYHLVNLTIHLAASTTLYFFTVAVVSALRQAYPNGDCQEETDSIFLLSLPFAVVMIFTVHPIQTQAVTYIVQRYTSLASLFYFLSALFYIKIRMEYELNGASAGFWLRGVICLVSGLLALWSKQIAYTLPIMLCVLEIFLFHGRLINRKLFIAAGFLTVLAMSTAVFIWQEGPVNKLLSDLYSATLETTGITRSTYFLTQLRVVVSYMRLLFLPVGQSLSHFPPLYSSLFALPVMASLLVHLVLLLCGVVLFRLSARNLSSPDNWGRGALQRMVSFGVVWFYVAMLVESSVIPIRDVMVEHRLYLPSAGFFMAVVSAVLLVVPDRSLSFKKLIIGFAMISLLLVGMTLLRNGVWETRESLWQDAVSKSPDNPLALSNLAGAYVALKQSEKAIPLYVRSMELKGDFQAFLLGEALQGLHRYGSRFTTGREYMRPGGPLGSGLLLDEDKAAYESTIYNTLGLSYEFLEEPGKAMKSYRMAVKLDPAYDLAWYNLGLLAARLGDTERVVTAVKTLRTINPDLGAQLESTLKQ